MTNSITAPTLEEITVARAQLGDLVRTTPVLDAAVPSVQREFSGPIHWKLELFQYAGSFKPRGALLAMLDLDPDALRRGVTAVSAGNHARAVAYAAAALGSSAKVVMPENANPFRVRMCRESGAEVELVPDVHRAFERVEEIVAEEGRTFVHPFEGPSVALGTGTLGLEMCEQIGAMDTVVVPIGGGGLCAGVSAAIKQRFPDCRVVGVEPTGADSMHRSFAAGEPASIDAVRTIADSLGAPFALPYSFELCRRYVDELVLIEDSELRRAMRLLFEEAKLAVEPAGAAATAALMGPLAGRELGRTALIVCGANIDVETFSRLCEPGQ